MAFRRRTAGYRAHIRRKARHPSATAARGAWSEYLPSRRATTSRRLPRPAVCACSASCRRLPAMLRANEALRVVRESLPRHQKCGAPEWLTVSGASGDACAARKLACTDSAQVEGRRRAGPERNPPPAHGRRREAALQGDGRYPDQAMQAAFADGCSARDQRRLRGGGARRSPATQSRPCQRWRITRPQMCRRKRSFRREAAQIAKQSSARAKRSARKGPR